MQNVINQFTQLAQDERVGFLGNVRVRALQKLLSCALLWSRLGSCRRGERMHHFSRRESSRHAAPGPEYVAKPRGA